MGLHIITPLMSVDLLKCPKLSRQVSIPWCFVFDSAYLYFIFKNSEINASSFFFLFFFFLSLVYTWKVWQLVTTSNDDVFAVRPI